MGRVRLASVTSEAIETEVLLKVWDGFHPRAVMGVDERSELTAGGLAVEGSGGLRVYYIFCIFIGKWFVISSLNNLFFGHDITPWIYR